MSNEPTGDSKSVQLIRLLNAIDEGNLSFEGLRRRLSEEGTQPSERTVRRYLAILSKEFPVYFDRVKNCYRFAGGYSLKRVDLSPEEILGLNAARSIGTSLGASIGGAISTVTQKMVGTAGRTARAQVAAPANLAFRVPQISLDERGEQIFRLVSSAEDASRSVAFSYVDKHGTTTHRTADPYGFVIHAGRIFAACFDHAKRDMRNFAIDGMSDVRVLGRTFVKPESFNVEKYGAASLSGLFRGPQTISVRVRYAPVVAKAAAAVRLVAGQTLQQLANGSIEIDYAVADVDELLGFVLSWGANAEVLTPAAARDRMAGFAQLLCAVYAIAPAPPS